MNRSFIPLLLATTIASCSRNDSTELFRKYCVYFPVHSSHITLRCGQADCERGPSLNEVDSSIVNRFGSRGAYALARIYPDRSFVSLLYFYPADSNIPWIVTYTTDGIKIDSLLIDGECNGDYGYTSSTFAIIDTGRSITVIDSIDVRTYDKSSKIIAGTDSTYIEVASHFLDETGHFVLRNKYKKLVSIK